MPKSLSPSVKLDDLEEYEEGIPKKLTIHQTPASNLSIETASFDELAKPKIDSKTKDSNIVIVDDPNEPDELEAANLQLLTDIEKEEVEEESAKKSVSIT